MIDIKDKQNCCGCSACVSICPNQCIELVEDNEGFLYPKVDKQNCIDCGLCEKSCIELQPFKGHVPKTVYAAVNKNEAIRLMSSSGGIFYYLAEITINKGGVVFGARFDENWQVVIDYAETINGVKDFMGSKYVQARIDKAYKDAMRFLIEGRDVLFSGTPCQIAGLYKYLRKPYENLLTVDFVCHGTPSPKVWGKYLNVLSKGIQNINRAGFRSKINGWKDFSIYVQYNKDDQMVSYVAPMSKDVYMRAFLQNLILRPSCHSCKVKNFSSHSDITIADFWGIQFILPQIDDDKGASLVFIHSDKVCDYFLSDDIAKELVNYEDIVKYNAAVDSSSKPHPNRNHFFERLDNEPLFQLILECTPISKMNIIRRLKNLVKRQFSKWGWIK